MTDRDPGTAPTPDAQPPAVGDLAAQGGVVGGMTLLSRISGLARDVLLSHVLGASAAADTFYLALGVPNFFRRLFAEGAFAQAFVPVLAEVRERGDRGALRRFVAAMAGNLGVVLIVAALLGVLGASALTALFMPGLFAQPERFALAEELTRIMFPYLALISLTAFAGAVLNSEHKFAVPAFTPVLLNASLVAAALWSAYSAGTPVAAAHALAWGVLAAGVLQLALQALPLKRVGLLVAPKPHWRDHDVVRVGKLLLPAVLAASAGQINALVASILASQLAEGSRSWLYYADRLMELPVGIVAIALGTVLLPNLSRLYSKGDETGFDSALDWGLRVGLLLGVPATGALAVLAGPLVATIFLHGEMRAADADATAAALQVFAAGLVPLVLVKIAAPGYFARQDTTTPLLFAAASVLVNVTLGIASYRWLGHLGLALATSAAAFVNAAALVAGLVAEGCYRPGAKLLRAALTSAVATAVMAAALWFVMPDPGYWHTATAWERIGSLALLVVVGAAVYASVAALAGIRPRDLRHRA